MLDDLVKAVSAELIKAEKIQDDTAKAAQEIAASASASPSQSGDRFHSQGAADIARQKYESILALKKEIEEKGNKIQAEFNGETLFLVDNPVILKGFKIVSTKSPLGLKILNGK